MQQVGPVIGNFFVTFVSYFLNIVNDNADCCQVSVCSRASDTLLDIRAHWFNCILGIFSFFLNTRSILFVMWLVFVYFLLRVGCQYQCR